MAQELTPGNHLLPGNVIAHTRNFDEALLARKLDETIPATSKLRVTGVMVIGYITTDPTMMRVVIRYKDEGENIALAAPWDLSLGLIDQMGCIVSD